MWSAAAVTGTIRFHPCHAEYIKTPHPLLIFSQSDYLIQVVDTNSHTERQTVQIQISWLQKPTVWICTVSKDRAYPGSAGPGLTFKVYNKYTITTVMWSNALYHVLPMFTYMYFWIMHFVWSSDLQTSRWDVIQGIRSCYCRIKLYLLYLYCWLSLSQNPRDSLKYIEIIRTSTYQICRIEKKIISNNHISQRNM